MAEVEEMFDMAFDPGTVSWHLQDRTWTEVSRGPDDIPLTDLQEELIRRTRDRRR